VNFDDKDSSGSSQVGQLDSLRGFVKDRLKDGSFAPDREGHLGSHNSENEVKNGSGATPTKGTDDSAVEN
jgi:hypothetical protein